MAFTTAEIGSYTQKSATWDESIHVTTGVAALERGDYRIDPEHPPFLRMWAALPLLVMEDVRFDPAAIDRTPVLEWAAERRFDFSHDFMYRQNDADRLLYAARFMTVLLGLLLGALLFWWAHAWLGLVPAVFALLFYGLEPNIAAHSALVTTDLGVTCFIFGTLFFLWRTCRQITSRDLTGLTVFFALAMVSKYTALVLPLIVLALLTLAVFGSRTLGLRQAVGILALLTVTSWLAIWAVYGFRYAPSGTPGWEYHLETLDESKQALPALSRAIGWVDGLHVLPNVYTQGFLLGQIKAQTRASFLAGRYSVDGWWYYFPAAFAMKTAVGLLALLGWGAVVVVVRRRSLGLANVAFVAVPVAMYTAMAMTGNLNIGVRHMLPVYPFVLLVAAVAAKAAWESAWRPARAVLGVLVVIWAAEFAAAYPHTLAFFNQLVGGPANGFKYLADSNVDWGQDLKPLKAWMTGGIL